MALLKLAFVMVTFLGSFLLFLVEAMAGKRPLPLLGGSAAVWTTCLVFFQVALLLGYLGRPPARDQAPAVTAIAGLSAAVCELAFVFLASGLWPLASGLTAPRARVPGSRPKRASLGDLTPRWRVFPRLSSR